MILIRGVKGKSFAQEITKGIIGCRDILSSLLAPPSTGYLFSDFFEKNLAKALQYPYYGGKYHKFNLHDPGFLFSLLVDYFVPHIYLTYFHILNEHSKDWLESFDENHSFFFIDVKLDRITKTALGFEYFGSSMKYVDSIQEISQNGFNYFNVAVLESIKELFPNRKDMAFPLQMYNTLSFPLLCREKDEKFTDIENEFRIIAYDCPRYLNGRLYQLNRETIITGTKCGPYRGTIRAETDSTFYRTSCLQSMSHIGLSDLLQKENGMVTLESKFKK